MRYEKRVACTPLPDVWYNNIYLKKLTRTTQARDLARGVVRESSLPMIPCLFVYLRVPEMLLYSEISTKLLLLLLQSSNNGGFSLLFHRAADFEDSWLVIWKRNVARVSTHNRHM